MKSCLILLLIGFLCLPLQSRSQQYSQDNSTLKQVAVLIRCDDIGMCHTVNEAIKQVLDTGLPISTSVMFVCPWYQEAVEVLKKYSNVSAGIHLTLNSEWKNYRWGPVAGWSAVPSLTDSLGYFFPSRAALFANNPKLDEVERELRAQIVRAKGTGLRIDYVDYHMGAAVNTLDVRQIVERLAAEYGLAISRYFGEKDAPGFYNAPYQSKKDTLVKLTRELKSGNVNLMVFHIGIESPEMDALVDMNTFGLPEMSKHRQAELNALLSNEFRSTLKEKDVRLITYRDLIDLNGLNGMKRPEIR